MGEVAQLPCLPAGQVAGPGGVEVVVDLLLLQSLAQQPVFGYGNHNRDDLTAVVNDVVRVIGRQFAHDGHGNDMGGQPSPGGGRARPARRALIVMAAAALGRRRARPSCMAADAPRPGENSDPVPLGQLIRGTPDVHPIEPIDELRSGAFETDEELEEFLSFVTRSRHVDLA